jgi:tripartite-type tricarboxylate transporter receptor subunit TctC
MRVKNLNKLCFLALLVNISLYSSNAVTDWPERPITIVVMYSTGGGTDTVLRALAREMSVATGWRINIVNRPGGAGALATRYVLNKRNDGYTLLGASNFNKYSRISGGDNSTSWEDWYFMQAASNTGSWAVLPDSRFKNFNDIAAAARETPGEITISTSGTGGQWHELAAVVAHSAGIELKYIPYGSGRLATLAGINGEVDIAGGGIHEHIQFFESEQLTSIQQTSPNDIYLSNSITLPSINNFLPSVNDQLPPNGNYNLGIRRDTPIDIIIKLQEAFIDAANSKGFRDFLASRSFKLDLILGSEADRRAAELEVISAATFERLDIPEARSPAILNLPSPEGFSLWWPPRSYKPLEELERD